MPTTIEITAYKFQELTDKAKQEVITRLAPDYQWWDHIYDHAKELGEAKGFRVDDINFSGFYSQGDGASWVGMVDLVKWLEVHKPDDAQAHILIALMENDWVDAKMNITQSGRYSHSNTMYRSDVSIACEDEDDTLSVGMFAGASVTNLMESLPDSYVIDTADEVMQDARSFADDIYKMLLDEYEYMCSEEYIAELCDANEYLFDENGRFV